MMGSSLLALDEREEPAVRICCGPRCGAEPGQRAIYAAVERSASIAGLDVAPTGCRTECGGGVTVRFPDGTLQKIRDVSEAKALKFPPTKQ